jgi:Flp pilus assembly protein TadG
MRFWRQRRGSTAVEFALILLPLVGLTLACLETAVMMFTSSVVQSGISAAARQVRTGIVRSATTGSCPAGGVPASTFSAIATSVLANAAGLVIPGLTYDVRSFSSFAVAQPPVLTFDGQGNPTNNCFDTGGANAIVSVRVAYNYTFITPGLGAILGGASTPSVPFVYTVIIQNEPFS